MLRSLYAGVSGMRCNQTKMDVIGNNISNVNTTGFKAGRVRFQDIFSQTMSSATGPTSDTGGINPKQVGLGVSLAAIDTIMTGGALQTTGRDLDLALEGDGFFTVSPDGGSTKLFTRDGAFFTDYEGNLVTANGMNVLGYAPFNVTANQYKTNADTIDDFETVATSSLAPVNTPGVYTFDITDKMSAGDTITINGVTLKAVAATATPGANEFKVGTDTKTTAANIAAAYDATTPDYTVTVSNSTITLTEKTGSGTDLAATDITSSNASAVRNFAITTNSVDIPGTPGVYSIEVTTDFLAGDEIDFDGITLTAGGATTATNFDISGGTDSTAQEIVKAYNLNPGRNYDATVVNSTITFTERVASGPDLVGTEFSVTHAGASGGELDNFTLITNADKTTKGIYSFELGTNFEPGKTITIGGITLTEGAAADFVAGGDTAATAANIVAAYNSTAPAPPYVASVSGSTITFTEKTASGNALSVTSTSNPVLDTVIATKTPGDTTAGINNPTSTSDTGKLSKLKIPKMLNGDKLETFAIDSSGLVSAVYGGTTYYLGRVAVSKFSNPEGLEKVGNNCYVDTDNSGEIQVGQAGSDGFGTIKSSTVEMSNVDLANEFTEMIITSRAYSANSRTITTSDEMLQELLNLKR